MDSKRKDVLCSLATLQVKSGRSGCGCRLKNCNKFVFAPLALVVKRTLFASTAICGGHVVPLICAIPFSLILLNISSMLYFRLS